MKHSNSQRNSTKTIFDDMDTVQVLALDGGGQKGLYSASVIKSLEDQLGHSICEHFDIITGTSTGGLIALALSLGISGKDIQHFYIQNGDLIFPSKGFWGPLRSIRWFFTSKYSNKELEKTLKELMMQDGRNQPILRDSKKRLIIPTFRAGESVPRLIKTPHAARYKSDWKMPMWAVGMATSAAPTYFPHFEYDGKTYLDGGLWANNPSLIGLVEALDLGANIKNIKLLNIGTTYSNSESIYSFRKLGMKRSGVLSWGSKLLPLMMQANSYATSSMYTHQLLPKGNLFTINKQVDSGLFNLDKIDNSIFVEMGESAGEEHFSSLHDVFAHQSHNYEPNEEALLNGIK